MSHAPTPFVDWRTVVQTDRYGPMPLDDASFIRLTGLVKLRYAARHLGIAPGDLRQRVANGRLHGQKVGFAWYVSESELERYVQRRIARQGRPR